MTETITLGGGCFWCTESVFVNVLGITDVESGYSNGQVQQPTYEQVCTGRTGHNEVVKLEYDPAQISLGEILEIFFVIHDPTTLNRQGADRGTQYRSAIFYHTDEQKAVAEKVKGELDKSGKFKDPIVTEITKAATFYKAEDYHQDYFDKNVPNKTGNYRYCQSSTIPKLKKLGLLKPSDE